MPPFSRPWFAWPVVHQPARPAEGAGAAAAFSEPVAKVGEAVASEWATPVATCCRGPVARDLGGAADLVRCPSDIGCPCTTDCCSLTDTVDPLLIGAEFFCPAGTVPFQKCDPAACACDVTVRDAQVCVANCCSGSDHSWSRSCIGGDWVCRGGVPRSECADVDCPCETHRAFLGDRCDGERMFCELSPRVFEECQPMACQTCDGADLPAEVDGCACFCTEREFVQCERVDG